MIRKTAFPEVPFGDPVKIEGGKFGGRKVFPKKLKEDLGEKSGSKCSICSTTFELRYLQIDHCIPYEVNGDGESQSLTLLCGSCNRAKSWSCEHCLNWIYNKDIEICRSCYWANPVEYSHIATQEIRQLYLTWKGNEVDVFEKIQQQADTMGTELPNYVKQVLERHFDNTDTVFRERIDDAAL